LQSAALPAWSFPAKISSSELAARYFSLTGEGSGPGLPPPALRTIRVTSG
jgi:hypothetical protein